MTGSTRFEAPDSRRTALVVLLALSLALAGCNILQGTSDASSLPSGEEAATKYDQLTGVTATVTTTMRRNGTTTNSTQRLAFRVGEPGFRNEIVAVDRPPSARSSFLGPGGLIVSNGTVRTIYQPSSNQLFRADISHRSPGRNHSRRRAHLRQLFAELRDDDNGTVQRPTPGISPLPVVPGPEPTASDGDGNETVPWREANVTAQYRGTETVAGQTAYVVSLRPVSDDTTLVASTLWLDTEYLFPIKSHRIIDQYGERYEYTTTFRNVTFNPDFDADTFRIDPGVLSANTSIIETAAYDSRRQLVRNSDLPIPDPTVPGGYEFERGSYRHDDSTLIFLTYTNGTARIHVTMRTATDGPTQGRTVDLGSRTGTFSQHDSQRTVSWQAAGRSYSVSGPVGNETLIAVARSVANG
jgi:outer membrane lipoprotein-sorting protein